MLNSIQSNILRTTLLLSLCLFGKAQAADPTLPAVDGPFEPTVESLQGYECPEWFRDAKFGIYVHWGVYSVPERGEWYAREMYMEGHDVYNHHEATYGHPSEFGYHQFIPMWKAEHFDPDAWLRLFKEAGAKYFTPCAIHHDGFALWDSDYSPFNAADMGPKKDLLGLMREATLKHGLRFGVTTHCARTISWMQTCYGADKGGPRAGVPYVTQDPAFNDLYTLPYYDANRADTENAPVWWKEFWLLRMRELIDNYRPDFVYLDSAVPFAGSDEGRTGLRLFAYFYNRNMAWHDGRAEGVLTHKGDKGEKRAPYWDGIATLDKERNMSGNIRSRAWQTDDSIGPWGYNATKGYKDANAVIDKMIDTVSKNGNYLLNVPPKADGTLDDATVSLLKEVGGWFRLNGEGIYATRPWKVFGEGPNTKMSGRANVSPYTAENIRFTQSKDGQVLYAVQMGWPGAGQALTLSSLGTDGPGSGLSVADVTMLGCSEDIAWQQTDEGVRISAPSKAPDELAVIYRIALGE